MDKKDNSNDLEQLVNPYAAPCNLYDSLAEYKALHSFYCVSAVVPFFTVMIGRISADYVKTITEMYEITNLVKQNYHLFVIVAGISSFASLMMSGKYATKMEDISLKIKNLEQGTKSEENSLTD